MSDIIHLLPDSVANQIAAGEVIQRPASVIKELVENAIDAGATNIKILVKDAGRTFIQVIDNGKGMSETDARLAFERHSTSKISSADDLFSLHTKGFRGEALASIAAVAHVELRTRRVEDEVGTLIDIAGSEVERQEPCSTAVGTSFMVKDLFYNVPARRKFLKGDLTEMRNILQEVHRIALIHFDLQFQLYQNGELVYDLQEHNFKQRITALFSKKNRNINQQLLKVEANTGLVNISGYVGKPESAGKSSNQYFFVNQRYMNHPYFRKAIIQAFERMLPPDTVPPFYIHMEVDPATIDVNIHPTKTEIKFENEREIWSILSICVKEALGKFNITSSIDFDTEGLIDIPVATGSQSHLQMPKVAVNPSYNPFEKQSYQRPAPSTWQPLYDEMRPTFSPEEMPRQEEWESEITPNNAALPWQQEETIERPQFINTEKEIEEQQLFNSEGEELIFQYKRRYICTSVKSGLMLVDIQRAKSRILYDRLLQSMCSEHNASQQLLFPEVLELTPEEHLLFTEIEIDLRNLGFVLEPFGKYAFAINAIPALLPQECDVIGVIHDLLLNFKEKGGNLSEELQGLIAQTLAKSAMNSPLKGNLTSEEMNHIIGELFAGSNPNHTPEGRNIIAIIDNNSIDGLF